MTKVFISYSRRDSAIARKIVDALKSREMDSWVDWEDIPPTADWLDQIHAGIEETDAFLFLISLDSLISQFCRDEFEYAAKNNKRLIPVIVRDVDPNQVPPVLGRHQWILFRPEDDFEKSFQRLETAIEIDLEWVQAHRRLQIRALEWERRKGRSLLLRGDDLRKAEEDLAASGQKDHQPTDLQRKFLLESRRSAARTRNLVGLISMIVAVALGIAAFIAVLRGNQATSAATTATFSQGQAQFNAATAEGAKATAVAAQATTAYSLEITQKELRQARVRQLSAQAELLLGQSPSMSLLLSHEAARLSIDANEPVTDETIQALYDGLAASSGIPLPGNTSNIEVMAVSPDGGWLAVAGKDSIIHIWDMNSSNYTAGPAFNLTVHQGSISHLAFLPDNRLVSAGEDSTLRVWDITEKDPAANPLLFTDIPTPIDDLAVSPNGRWLAAGSGNQSMVQLWDLSAADPQARTFRLLIRDTKSGFYDLAFSPDGKMLAAAKGIIIATWNLADSPVEISQSVLTQLPLFGGSYVGYPPRVLAFTSDSHWLIAGADTGIVACAVETITTCSPIALRSSFTTTKFGNYSYRLYAMAVSPDGNWLAASFSDNTLKLWDISDGFNREPILLKGHLGPVTALAFSADGHWLASSGGEATNSVGNVSSSDGTTRLWDLASDNPNVAPTVLITGSRFPRLAFTPSGNWLAASSGNTAVRLLDMRTLSFSLDPLNLGSAGGNTGFSFTFDNNEHWLSYLTQATTMDSTYAFLDLAAPNPLTTITSLEKVSNPAFSPDGKWLAYNQTRSWVNDSGYPIPIDALLLANLTPGKNSAPQTLWPAETGSTYPYLVAFSPDSRWLLHFRTTTVGWNLTVLLYDLTASGDSPPNYRKDFPLDNQISYLSGIPNTLISLDSHWLAVNVTGYLMDLAQNDLSTNPLTLRGYKIVSFSPDGQLASVIDPVTGDAGIIKMSSEDPVSSIIILKRIPVPAFPPSYLQGWPIIQQFTFSSDNRWLLLVTCDKSQCLEDSQRTITLWDLAQSDPASKMEELPAPAAPPVAAFSPDSHWLGTLDVDGKLILRNLESGETTQPFSASGWAQFLFDPASRWLAALDDLGNAALYDLAYPTKPAIRLNNRYPIAALAFNHDGSLLAGGASSGKILLWKMTNFDPNSPPTLLTGGTQDYNRVVFTSDGRLLIADGPNAPIIAWHMNLETMLSLACQAAGRNLTQTEWNLYGFTEDYRATCPQWPLEPEATATPTIIPTSTP
jgi:WD40 repeat protein